MWVDQRAVPILNDERTMLALRLVNDLRAIPIPTDADEDWFATIHTRVGDRVLMGSVDFQGDIDIADCRLERSMSLRGESGHRRTPQRSPRANADG